MARTFLQTNSFSFVDCVIHYQAAGRSPAELTNFTGTSVLQLKEAIKKKSQLPVPSDIIKLFVGKPGKEKKALDELRKALGISFDLRGLMTLIMRILSPLSFQEVKHSDFVFQSRISANFTLVVKAPPPVL